MKDTLSRSHYPRQFWLIFAGMILSSLGTTMIWPFLMIYVSERLSLSLAAVASLMAVLAFWWLQARAARDVTIIS